MANRIVTKSKTRKRNSVDPDEKTHYASYHLDLHRLQRLFVVSRAERVKYILIMKKDRNADYDITY